MRHCVEFDAARAMSTSSDCQQQEDSEDVQTLDAFLEASTDMVKKLGAQLATAVFEALVKELKAEDRDGDADWTRDCQPDTVN